MVLGNLKNFFTKGNERSIKAKKNILGSILVKGCSIAIQLMLVPLTLGYLSNELYGVWLTLSSIMLWLNFFDVGFTLGMKNKLTEALALNNLDRAKRLVSTTYFMLIVIFVPLGIILQFIVGQINWCSFLNVQSIYQNQIILTLRVLIMSFVLQMILNALTSILAAYQKVALSSTFPVIGNLLAVIVIWILTKTTTASLVILSLAISFLPVVVLIISSIILFNNKLHEVAPCINSIRISLINEIFSLGWRFFTIQIQVVVLYQTTNMIISNLSSPEMVTSYNIAYRYIGTFSMLFSIIMGSLWPAFTDAYTKNDFNWMRHIYGKMTKLYQLLIIIIAISIIGSPIVYHIWLGDKTIVSWPMIISVAIFTIINAWDHLQVNLINGIGAIKLQTYVTLIGLVCHIPLSYGLGHYYGGLGVVFSMTIINIIYATFFTIQIRKILNKTATGIWLR